MKPARALGLGPVLLSLAAAFGCGAPPAPRAGAGPHRLALLVGVDGAPRPGLAPLHGAQNDVAGLAALLVGRFGFDPRSVARLVDAEADAAGVTAALAALADQAGPGDEVVFQFSGHGLRVLDQNGDEADGYDEALLLADGTTLLDDDLGHWLQAVAARGAHATVIIDACHSGTAVRDAAPMRGVPLDAAGEATALDPHPADAVDRPMAPKGGAQVRGAEVQLGDYMLLSAAAAGQRAHEVRTPGGKHHGALTWHLLDALAQADAHTTWRMVAARVRAGVTALAPGQVPQIEGPGARRTVFGTGVGGLGHRVLPGSTPGTVQVMAGRLLGLAPGHRLRPLDADFKDTELTITRADALSSEAAVTGPALPPGALVRPASRTLTPFRLSLGLPDPVPPSLAEALAAQPTLVAGGADAPLRVVLREGGVQLLATDGSPLGAVAPLTDVRALERVLDRAARQARWLALQSLVGPASLPMVLRLGPAHTKAKGLDIQATAGEVIEISVENQGSVRLYLHLFSLDDAGEVSLLYPPPGASEHLDAGGRWSGEAAVSLREGATHEENWLVLIGTTVPTDLSALAAREDAPVTRGMSAAELGLNSDRRQAPLTAWAQATALGTRSGPIAADADAFVVRHARLRIGPAGLPTPDSVR